MKTILVILLSFTLTASFAQHFGFPVKELDSLAAKDTNTFYHHPVYLDVELSQKTLKVSNLSIVTTYDDDTTSPSPIFIAIGITTKAKNTVTSTMLELPKDALPLTSAVNADGKSYNIANLNNIIQLWGLQYDTESKRSIIIPQ